MDVVESKLIDFNTSVLLSEIKHSKKCIKANGTRIYKAPEIRTIRIRKVRKNKNIHLKGSKNTVFKFYKIFLENIFNDKIFCFVVVF